MDKLYNWEWVQQHISFPASGRLKKTSVSLFDYVTLTLSDLTFEKTMTFFDLDHTAFDLDLEVKVFFRFVFSRENIVFPGKCFF